ncbi:MAG TPA: glycosyltransferase, partial [Actinomycetota bacterium]|nr:glycosyltransferase [Actinomycetota bacterium]
MRVLHLTTEYPPIIYGGLGTAIGGLVEASARSGLEVGVLLIGETGLAAYAQQAQSNESIALEAFALPQGVRIFPTPWGAAADYALRLVSRWQPDVIHLHVFWLWGIAKQLQEMTGIPLVYTVHSLDVAEYQLGGGPTQCLDQWP